MRAAVGSRAQGGIVASGALDGAADSTHGAALAIAKRVTATITTATAVVGTGTVGC